MNETTTSRDKKNEFRRQQPARPATTSEAVAKTVHTRRELFNLSNSLAGALKSLEGVRITIDLRNEHTLTGICTHIDGFMNIDLTDVRYYNDPVYEPHRFAAFEQFLIRNRQIRYVHFPKDFNVTVAIQAVLRRLFGRRDPKTTRPRPYTHKIFANKVETLRDLNRDKQSNAPTSLEH